MCREFEHYIKKDLENMRLEKLMNERSITYAKRVCLLPCSLPYIRPPTLHRILQRARLCQISNVHLTAPLPHHTKLNKTLHTPPSSIAYVPFLKNIAHWFSLVEIGALHLHKASISTQNRNSTATRSRYLLHRTKLIQPSSFPPRRSAKCSKQY